MNDVFTDGLRCALRPIRRQCGRWVAIVWLMSAGGCASTPMLNSELFNALTPTNQVLTAGTTWRVTAIDGRAVSSAKTPPPEGESTNPVPMPSPMPTRI